MLLALAIIAVLTWTPVASVSDGCLFGVPCGMGHAIAFAILGVPLAGVFATSRLARRSPRRALAMVFLALWIVAAVDELVQPSVGRVASLEDWALDMAGGMTSFLASGAVLRLLGARLGWFPQVEVAPAAALDPASIEVPPQGEGEPRRTRSRRRRRR